MKPRQSTSRHSATEPKNLTVEPVALPLFPASKAADTALEASIEPGLCLRCTKTSHSSWETMVSRIKQSPNVHVLLALALALLACFGVSLLLRAQATQQIWILPGAAETTGLFGARFSSTLFLANLGNTAASVQIGF